ncbi:MAG: CTP synthetase [Marivita sp.]|uniref:CTP synthetase n=1 Tax=Marivita sp. TaxID=2003365 RepID=UPI0025BCBAEB|nr:CTP synthetase [Marivita sp.]MCI5109396.1 CTP synthetase [Marivita sp.]
MLLLARILYSLIAATLSGSGVVLVLVAGYDSLWPILIAAAAGAVLAAPISYVLARKLYSA